VSENQELTQRVEKALDMIRPALRMDGGDIELVEVTGDGVVRVRLQGACVGCPSAAITLQAGVEATLKEQVPEVVRVENVPTMF
jgi:Fe-S cluster biogenesis protein NfuA